MATVNRMSECDAAYLAGIVDGEGTITLTRTHRGENRRPIVSISSTELRLLHHVKAIVGAGRITTKACAQTHHSPSFAFTISSRQALLVLEQIGRFLKTYKAERSAMLLAEYAALTPRNGRYSEQQRAAREAFERRFFSVSIRAGHSGVILDAEIASASHARQRSDNPGASGELLSERLAENLGGLRLAAIEPLP